MKRMLTKILDSTFKLSNLLLWRGEVPFLENYSFYLADPQGQWQLWLRLNLEWNQTSRWGRVQACFTDEWNLNNCQFEECYDLNTHEISHSHSFLKLGQTSFTLAGFLGEVKNSPGFLRWDFLFEDPVLSWSYWPQIFYKLGLCRFYFQAPQLARFVSGHFFVNHKKYDLQSVQMWQGHAYGRQPFAHQFLHGHGFKLAVTPASEIEKHPLNLVTNQNNEQTNILLDLVLANSWFIPNSGVVLMNGSLFPLYSAFFKKWFLNKKFLTLKLGHQNLTGELLLSAKVFNFTFCKNYQSSIFLGSRLVLTHQTKTSNNLELVTSLQTTALVELVEPVVDCG